MSILSRIIASIVTLFGWLEVQKHRRSLYGAAVFVMPFLIGGSYLTDGQASRVLAILAALAGIAVPGLARKHTKGATR